MVAGVPTGKAAGFQPGLRCFGSRARAVGGAENAMVPAPRARYTPAATEAVGQRDEPSDSDGVAAAAPMPSWQGAHGAMKWYTLAATGFPDRRSMEG